MTLTPEQKKAVSAWVAAGDGLSAVQKKLSEEFKLSMTYRDVRFLIDDLNLQLKDAAPKVDTSDVTKAQPAAVPAKPAPEKKGFIEKAKAKLGLAENAPAGDAEDGEMDEDFEDMPPGGASSVHITVDNVTLIPSALASGTVAFSDGVMGKWIVDQYGRPGFTEISQPGYRPSAADSQAFVRELSAALQNRGL